MIIGRRYRMVEQYLNGTMSGSDLNGFLRRLERDNKLRCLLEEEQSIQKAMLLDKASIPIIAKEFPEHLVKKLDDTPAPQHRESPYGGGPGLGSSGETFLGQSLLRVIFASAAILIAIVGMAYIFGSSQPPVPSAQTKVTGNAAGTQNSQLPNRTSLQPAATAIDSTSGTMDVAGKKEQAGDGPSSSGRASDQAPASAKPKDVHAVRRDKASKSGADAGMRANLDKDEQNGSVSLVRREPNVRMRVTPR
jgi:hypothetical protein